MAAQRAATRQRLATWLKDAIEVRGAARCVGTRQSRSMTCSPRHRIRTAHIVLTRLEQKLLEQPAQLERRTLAAVAHDGVSQRSGRDRSSSPKWSRC